MNKKISLVLFCLFTFFLFNLNCYAYDYDILNYDIDIVVNENNLLKIKETIEVNFNEYRHGIYRTIPLVNDVTRIDGSHEKNRVVISNVKVNENFSKFRENGEIKLQIGDADNTIIGDKTYVISYDYFLGNDKNVNYDELYYNIIGTSWDTEIKNVSFKITMPKSFDVSKLGFTHGKYLSSFSDGIDYSLDGKVIKGFYSNILMPGEALTVRLELDEGYFIKDTWQNHISELFWYIVPVIFVFISYCLWNKYGRDEQVVETVEFYPPKGCNSLDVAYLYKGYVNSKDTISLLIYLANKGYVKIEETDDDKFVITKIKDYDGDNKEESLFLKGLFKKGDSVKKSDLENDFYRTINKVVGSISNLKNHNLIFEKMSYVVRFFIFCMMFITLIFSTIFSYLNYRQFDYIGVVLLWAFVISIISILVGKIFDHFNSKFSLVCTIIIELFVVFFALMIMYNYDFYGFYDVVYSIGLVISYISFIFLFLFYLIITKRTNYGVEILGKLRGFKTFLETAEKDRLEALVMDNPSYFYDILPYTYVFDLSKVWIDQFEDIAIEPPNWYVGSSNFNVLSFGDSLERTVNSATTAMTSTPQSDYSGGGSGGGFSGGGSGGGGGGSW